MAGSEIYRVEIPIIVDDQTEAPLRQAEERVSRFQRTAEKRTKTARDHMTKLAKMKIEPIMRAKDQLTNSVINADRLIKKLGMGKASPLIEAQDRASAVVARVDAALQAVDRGDVKVIAEMQGPLMDEIVKAKASLKALEGVRTGPVAELRGELFGQLTRAFTEAKKLGQLMVEPRATLRERVTWKVREIGTGLRQLTSRAWTVTIEAKDKVAGVAKRIGSVLTSPLGLLGVGGGAVGLGALIKDFVMTAGRTETLNIAMESVAKSTGTSMKGLLKQREAVMDLGIAEQEATSVMTRFMQGQLDIAEAAKVARVAQDAAVIAGVNSSEATQTIVEAIAKLSPELLTAFGMTKNLNDVYADYADRIGIVVKTKDKYGKTVRHMTRDMTEAEKKQAMLNYVLEEGAKIAGTYEMSMGSAFKKMGSLARYWTDFKTKVGAPLFLAAFGSVIDGLTDAFKSGIKWAERNQKTLEQWGKKVAGVFDRAMARIKSVLGSPEFQNAKFSEKVQMLIEAGLDDVITWLDGPGKEKLASVFVTLGETSVKAYIAGMKALGSKTVEELKEGNIKGAAVPAAAMYLLGGGAIARGAWGLGKGALGIGGKVFKRLPMSTTVAETVTAGSATRAAAIGAATKAGAGAGKFSLPAFGKIGGAIKGITTKLPAFSKAGETIKNIGSKIPAAGTVGKVLGRVAMPLAIGAELIGVARSQDKVASAAKAVGGLSAGLGGAKLGAAIGTAILPGIGTAIGGALGGIGGYVAGGWVGSKAVDMARDVAWRPPGAPATIDTMIETSKANAVLESFGVHLQEQANAIISNSAQMATQAWNIVAIKTAYAANLQNRATDIIAKMNTWSEQTWDVVATTTAFGANLQTEANSIIANGEDLAVALGEAATRARSFRLPAVPGVPATLPLPGFAYGGFADTPSICGEAGPEAIIPLTKPTRALELWRQVGSIMGFATETQDRAINENWQQVANISETTDRLTNVKNVIETEKRLADVTDIAQYQRLKQKNEAVTERLKHFSASDSHMSGQMRGQRLGVEARARANVINLAEYRNIRAYATGGFASRPSIFGEAGPEAAIPLSSRMRGRALTLWEETGRRLGVKAYAYGGFADTVQALPVAAGWEHNVPVNPAPSIPATTATVNLNFDLAGLVGQVVIENQEDIDKAIGKITVKLAEGLEKTFQNMTRSN